nr:carboxypeptidase-like regulatory domain-containing protein [uncultured Psychroserpens sp.]
MRTTLNINIPTPCHEDWNIMTPQQKGRHCASCEKTVFDFTSKTDEQIIKTYQNQGNLCGRFKSTQLDRELVLNRKEKNNYISYAASTLFAFLSFGSMDVEAQEQPKVIALDSSHNPTVKGKIAVSILSKTINGTVTDSYNGLPILGVNVVIKGTNTGVATDFDGHYKLKAKKGDTLVFSLLGYEKKEIMVSNSNTYNLAYQPSDLDIMGEIMIYDPKIEKTHNKHEGENLDDEERSDTGQLLYKITNIFRRKK